ncbi:hypothetical protein [Tropicibacter alexandrii]|nr:hypothetical protein [Tropicibacter alexandrii]
MLGIFAKSFMTATRSDDRRAPAKEPTRWLDADLPFRRFADRRND